MHQVLTASRIKSAIRSAKTECRELWLSDDPGTRGTGRLVLRVSPLGVPRFYYRPTRTHQGTTQAIPLGIYSRTRRDGYLTLTEARHRTSDLLASAYTKSKKNSPRPDSQSTKPAPVPVNQSTVEVPSSTAPTGTLIELCRAYVQKLEDDGKASANDVRGCIERHVAPSNLARMIAREIRPADFTSFLREILSAVSGNTARKVRSYVQTAYALAMRSNLDPTAPAALIDFGIETNPIVGIDAMSQFNVARTRSLRDSELREVWRRLQPVESLSIPARGVRLSLLLCGQRAQQLVAVPVRNVDLEANTILLLDTKGRRSVAREHLLPLCSQSRIDVHWLVGYAKSVSSDYLFPGSRKGTAMNTSSMSGVVVRIRHEMETAGLCEDHFSFIDFRRTIETKLASLGVSKDYRAQIQSHGLSGVQNKHYDRHDYMAEKLSVLTLWEDFLSSLLLEPI